jgi:hypothetical protein
MAMTTTLRQGSPETISTLGCNNGRRRAGRNFGGAGTTGDAIIRLCYHVSYECLLVNPVRRRSGAENPAALVRASAASSAPPVPAVYVEGGSCDYDGRQMNLNAYAHGIGG